MKRALRAATALSTTILFLVPGAVLAQSDYDWSGFYAGFTLGGAKSSSSLDFDYSSLDFPVPPTNSFSGGGSTLGANAGYNWQNGNLLVGIEADINTLAFTNDLNGPGFTAQEQLHALLSTRARLGVAFDQFLFYGTAGVAAGQASIMTDVGKGDPVSSAGIVTGTVVGAGVEYAVSDNVSVQISTKTYNLSPLTTVGDDGKGPSPYTATYTPRPMVFEAGLNVHF